MAVSALNRTCNSCNIRFPRSLPSDHDPLSNPIANKAQGSLLYMIYIIYRLHRNNEKVIKGRQ